MRHILTGIVAAGLLAGVPVDRYLSAQTSPAARVDTAPPLVASLLRGFRTIDPRLTSVRILGLLAGLDGSDTARYAVLALARGEARTDSRIPGELYGVFAVDKLLHSARRLGEFPSPRRGDYDAWLLEARGDSVIVCGRGEMYGDVPGRWAFPFDPVNYGPMPVDQAEAVEDPGDGSPAPKTCPDLKQ